MNQFVEKKYLKYNTLAALLNQVVNLCCSFVLPRLILLQYGSATNGLVTSITQFLGFISLMEFGVGAVIQSSLYKPLSENDKDTISMVVKAANLFFRNIARVLVVYTVFLMLFFCSFANVKKSPVYVALMILVLSINTFAQYYFGITNQLLLNADQKSYIQLLLNGLAVFLNTLICVLLIKIGASILIVKLFSAIVLLIRPIGMSIYVNKHYAIDRKIQVTGNPIEQKWNGLYHHIASFVLQHTDVAVLTVFSSLESVSIYGVYQLVTNGLNQVVTILTTGHQAFFGALYARNDYRLKTEFEAFEWKLHNAITMVFTVAGVLISGFVVIYTNGAADAQYAQPLFGSLLVFAQGACCLRMPYNIMVKAAGHYKQTQNSALIEALLNIGISIVLVRTFGLVGVAIGTLIAMLYRTIYLAAYIGKYIVRRGIQVFIKQCTVDALIVVLTISVRYMLPLNMNNYLDFLLQGIMTTLIAMIFAAICNVVFYRDKLVKFFNEIKMKCRG